MFGFIADTLTSITSILFPIFASYKALKTSDPALLTPWLMYWTTLSLFLAAESFFAFILTWIPFYAWLRLALHLYLVLPGKQGSVYIYQTQIQPFLEDHERQIDRLISDGHEKAKAAGLQYLKHAIEYTRVRLLHQAPKQPSPPPSRNVSYSTALLSRFNMPSARDSPAPAGTSDLFGLLGSALHQITYPTSTTRGQQAADIAAAGSLIPPHMSGDERAAFVATQRERLRLLLQALDTEALPADFHAPSPPHAAPSSRNSFLAPTAAMSRSRSESEFEDLGFEAMPDTELDRAQAPQTAAQGWSGWIWGNYGERDSAVSARKEL